MNLGIKFSIHELLGDTPKPCQCWRKGFAPLRTNLQPVLKGTTGRGCWRKVSVPSPRGRTCSSIFPSKENADPNGPLPVQPSKVACPQQVKADSDTEGKESNLSCSHRQGKLGSCSHLSSCYTRSVSLFSFFMFYSQRALVNNSHTVTN